MAQDNAALMQLALDDLVTEYRQHCADRVLGKERVTYSLNGRNFEWGQYSKNVLAMIRDTQAALASFSIPYAEIQVG